MEQKNSQERDKKIFSDLICDPSAITADDAPVLKGLVDKYPYSQLLRYFYTRSLVDSDPAYFEKELSKAALCSPDRLVLRTIIEDPESLKSFERKSDLNIPSAKESAIEASDATQLVSEIQDEQESPKEKTGDDGKVDAPEIDTEANEELSDPDVTDEVETENEVANILSTESETPIVDLFESKDKLSAREERDAREHDLAANLMDSLVNDKEKERSENLPNEEQLDSAVKQDPLPTDYLKEDEEVTSQDDNTEEVFKPESDIAESITHNAIFEDKQKVSRYDDDKMPYSFLWWLSKTRKEHSDNYQPYVSFQLDTSQTIKRNTVDQLSSQIIENIFHLQSPIDELEDGPKTVPFQVKRKEDLILEKFIREEPQIKPPNTEKLNNENKARKSAEDPNDLVSETLAQIYTDQMLFDKSIETYRKLSLKFPEKSTYFADQIRELEKKIN